MAGEFRNQRREEEPFQDPVSRGRGRCGNLPSFVLTDSELNLHKHRLPSYACSMVQTQINVVPKQNSHQRIGVGKISVRQNVEHRSISRACGQEAHFDCHRRPWTWRFVCLRIWISMFVC